MSHFSLLEKVENVSLCFCYMACRPMWKRKMVRVSQLSFRLLPRARNVWFRLSPTELLSGKIKGKFDDVSAVPERRIERKNDLSETYGFRRLTADEKKEFENSLNRNKEQLRKQKQRKPISTEKLTPDEAQAALESLNANKAPTTAREAVELLKLKRALEAKVEGR